MFCLSFCECYVGVLPGLEIRKFWFYFIFVVRYREGKVKIILLSVHTKNNLFLKYESCVFVILLKIVYNCYSY
jgi:hypothetical protein